MSTSCWSVAAGAGRLAWLGLLIKSVLDHPGLTAKLRQLSEKGCKRDERLVGGSHPPSVAGECLHCTSPLPERACTVSTIMEERPNDDRVLERQRTPGAVLPLQECQQGSCHQSPNGENLCVVHQHMVEKFPSVTGGYADLGGLNAVIAATLTLFNQLLY